MSGIQQELLGGPFGVAAYQIQRSLRFNSADSAYLNRTFGTATDRKIMTFSWWMKKCNNGTLQSIFSAITTNDRIQFGANVADDLTFSTNGGSTSAYTPALFRDNSAFYHFVIAVDTNQATAANRVKIYVNNVQQTLNGTFPAQNATLGFNNAVAHSIGRDQASTSQYFDGYLTEINFIDGQALTPSSFGETNPTTGVWQPKAYTGSYGTNGFYLNFSDNASTTTLGDDLSGNGNDWSTSGFSVTAGAGNDSLVDTPTPYGTDTGAGGEVRGNYATLNPLALWTGSGGTTLSNGNLEQTASTLNATGGASATIAMSGGKFYWEVEFDVIPSSNQCGAGLYDVSVALGGANSWQRTGHWILGDSGLIYLNGSAGSASGTGAFSAGNIAQFAFDSDTGKLWVGKDNTWVGVPGTSGEIATLTMSGKAYAPLSTTYSNAGAKNICNFGQRAFAYTAPSGFKALCTQNLPTPTIGATSTTQANDYFNPVLYTGTGSSLSVTGVGFQPDFVWIKERAGAADHGLYDAVRGVQKQLESNTTTEETTETTGLTAFGTDGFTVGALAQLNTNTDTYVAWCWNAGGSNATNTSGTITSTVRANTTAGFSIVTYTGTGANATVGHGLGVAPQMIIHKCRGTAATNWPVYHVGIGNTAVTYLNSTTATSTTSAWLNNTSPTSTVWTIGTDSDINGSTRTYVAYCFAPVAGYSAFGSYTGNGSTDGPFIFTGFRPKFVFWKNTSTTSDWQMKDAARSTYNVTSANLYANLSNAENSAGDVDFLSNGFKLRSTGTDVNGSGNTIIYAAFAENPFKYSLAR